MGRRALYDKNLGLITNKMEAFPSRGVEQLKDLLFEFKDSRILPGYLKFEDFKKNLIRDKIIIEVESSENHIAPKYWNSNSSLEEFSCNIYDGAYLSYFSALTKHQLTQQIPKTIFISVDRKRRNKERTTTKELEQENVDYAFSSVKKKSTESFKINNTSLVIIRRPAFPDNVGVKKQGHVKYTDLERTLIDIAVRPEYSGGFFSVSSAYRKAGRNIDVDKLFWYSERMDFIYPYQQLFGFYLNHFADFQISELSDFSEKISHLNFYTTKNMSEFDNDLYWQINYPPGALD